MGIDPDRDLSSHNGHRARPVQSLDATAGSPDAIPIQTGPSQRRSAASRLISSIHCKWRATIEGATEQGNFTARPISFGHGGPTAIRDARLDLGTKPAVGERAGGNATADRVVTVGVEIRGQSPVNSNVFDRSAGARESTPSAASSPDAALGDPWRRYRVDWPVTRSAQRVRGSLRRSAAAPCDSAEAHSPNPLRHHLRPRPPRHRCQPTT